MRLSCRMESTGIRTLPPLPRKRPACEGPRQPVLDRSVRRGRAGPGAADAGFRARSIEGIGLSFYPPFRRKHAAEAAATSRLAVDVKPGLMPQQNVLDDGKTKPGTASGA